MKLFHSILLLAAMPVFAQLESHTMTISASRQTYLQPDEAMFDLEVSSNPDASLDEIVAALSRLSITAANFTGVNDYNSPGALQWSFALAVPFSDLAPTIGALTNLEQTIAQNNSGLALTLTIDGIQVSPQLQESQSCSTSDLIADARAQAQKLAAAAGLAVGPILRLSNVSATAPAITGIVGYVVSLTSFLMFTAAPPPVTCSLAVEFQLNP